MTPEDQAELGWPRLPATLASRARRVRLLALDVDGVLTDGRLSFDEAGRETKHFHVRDGHGIKRARQHGIEVVWVTGRSAPQLVTRAAELGVTRVRQGVGDKRAVLRELTIESGLDREAVAAIGDDLPDLGLFAQATFAIAVADAVPELRAAADWVTRARGGCGAVREAIESILLAREVG